MTAGRSPFKTEQAMRLPNVNRAEIDERTLRDDLLSEEHPVGRFKAAFFRAIGFERNQWPALRVREEEEVQDAELTSFWTKYRIRGEVQSESGRRAEIVVVGIVRPGEAYPRFVTAYPG